LVVDGPVLVDEEFYLWPENLPAFNIWMAIQTQWMVSEGYRTGLNYPGVETYLNICQVPKRDRLALFQKLQAMEGAALSEWSKNRKK
jgi:hypothetical protein